MYSRLTQYCYIAPAIWIILPVNLGIQRSAIAQVLPDNSLPTTITSSDNQNFVINGGSTAGANLFHSFDRFSVPTNGSVRFNNATNIDTIFSRITGSRRSTIDGLIQANGSANLFLMNPNGIIFGKNASLDIGGSFVSTTAESILFGDDIQFSVDISASPLLSINVPTGIQFGETAATITNQSQSVDATTDRIVGLQVPSGQTLALLGGNIHLNRSALTTAEGRIELGSVRPQNTVNVAMDQSVVFDYPANTTFQTIRLTNGAIADVSGRGGGDLQVYGRHIYLTGGSQLASVTLGENNGGALTIYAHQSLQLLGASEDGFVSGLYTDVFPDATGNGSQTRTKTFLRIRWRGWIARSSFLGSHGSNFPL